MKLLLSISFMCSIFFTEVGITLLEISDYEVFILDITTEGESEKESSEKSKKDIKISVHSSFLDYFDSDLKFTNSGTDTPSLDTQYLEIHSPPPRR